MFSSQTLRDILIIQHFVPYLEQAGAKTKITEEGEEDKEEEEGTTELHDFVSQKKNQLCAFPHFRAKIHFLPNSSTFDRLLVKAQLWWAQLAENDFTF